MDTIYDVIRIGKLWHVCKLSPDSNERWELSSNGFVTRAQAFTEMHSQRWADKDSRQLVIK